MKLTSFRSWMWRIFFFKFDLVGFYALRFERWKGRGAEPRNTRVRDGGRVFELRCLGIIRFERDFERDNPFWRLARRGRIWWILARSLLQMFYCRRWTLIRWVTRGSQGNYWDDQYIFWCCLACLCRTLILPRSFLPSGVLQVLLSVIESVI